MEAGPSSAGSSRAESRVLPSNHDLDDQDRDISDDELLEGLEDELEDGEDGFMAGYREQRLAEMKREYVSDRIDQVLGNTDTSNLQTGKNAFAKG